MLSKPLIFIKLNNQLHTYRIRQNFRGGKFSRLCTKHTIHWKTFAVHQAHAIMYCTRQMIQGENFRDWLKNRENHKSFPPRKFCRMRYLARFFSNLHLFQSYYTVRNFNNTHTLVTSSIHIITLILLFDSHAVNILTLLCCLGSRVTW